MGWERVQVNADTDSPGLSLLEELLMLWTEVKLKQCSRVPKESGGPTTRNRWCMSVL